MPADFELIPAEGSATEVMRCRVRLASPNHLGKAARFSLQACYEVQDSRPVNNSRVLFSTDIPSLTSEFEVEIPRSACSAFSYRGKKLHIVLRAQLKVDDGVLFDSTLSEAVEVALHSKPRRSLCAASIADPKDVFCIRKNFSAIPYRSKIIFLLLCLCAGVLITINTLVGVHDQFSPESQTYFYSHRDSDGESQSPLLNSLFGSGVLGALVWAAMRRQLKKYMTFSLKKLPERIDAKTSLRIQDLISGRSRVALEKVNLRVIACNMEHGQYKRGSGTSERTVSFKEPVNGVMLYEQKVDYIPAGAEVANYFPGDFAFLPMFASLYPSDMCTNSHGLAVYWEVQLLHGDFVDQELVCSVSEFVEEDFWNTGDHHEPQQRNTGSARSKFGDGAPGHR